MGAKYDPQAEAEVRHWFKQLLNEDIGDGSMTVEKNLKDGILLIKYVRNILPPAPSITFTKKTQEILIMYSSVSSKWWLLLTSSHANTNESIRAWFAWLNEIFLLILMSSIYVV